MKLLRLQGHPLKNKNKSTYPYPISANFPFDHCGTLTTLSVNLFQNGFDTACVNRCELELPYSNAEVIIRGNWSYINLIRTTLPQSRTSSPPSRPSRSLIGGSALSHAMGMGPSHGLTCAGLYLVHTAAAVILLTTLSLLDRLRLLRPLERGEGGKEGGQRCGGRPRYDGATAPTVLRCASLCSAVL